MNDLDIGRIHAALLANVAAIHYAITEGKYLEAASLIVEADREASQPVPASTDVEALYAKADRWRKAGWFTDSQWGAVMAVLYVEATEGLTTKERERWQVAGQRAAAHLAELRKA